MEGLENLVDATAETEEVFVKRYICPIFPERTSCVNCVKELTCVSWRKDEQWIKKCLLK